MRTYLFCGGCGRRTNGKTRRGHAYYVCAPKKGYVPEGHLAAGSFWIREDAIVAKLNEFLSAQVQLEGRLAEVEEENQRTANPDLLDVLPMGEVRVEGYRRTSRGGCSKPSGSNSATARPPTG